jgi:hypothetical protein
MTVVGMQVVPQRPKSGRGVGEVTLRTQDLEASTRERGSRRPTRLDVLDRSSGGVRRWGRPRNRASVQPAGHRPAVALELIPELRSQGILLDADLGAVDRQDKRSRRQHRDGRSPQDRIRNQQAGHSDVHRIPRQPVRAPDHERPGPSNINRIDARALSTELLNAPCEKPSGSQRDNRCYHSGSRPHRTVASDEMLAGRQTRNQQCRGNTELAHFFPPNDNPLRNPTIEVGRNLGYVPSKETFEDADHCGR